MNSSLFPNEKLRKELTECGLIEEKQHVAAMKAVLAAYFGFSQIHHLNDPDEIAEILIYLTQKRLLKIKKEGNPG